MNMLYFIAGNKPEKFLSGESLKQYVIGVSCFAACR